MASEVVYAEVSPKERVHFTSLTSDTGDPVTYAEVNVEWPSDRLDSTPKTTHTDGQTTEQANWRSHSCCCKVTCLQHSPWCYVALTLYFTAMILFITVILLAVKCHHL